MLSSQVQTLKPGAFISSQVLQLAPPHLGVGRRRAPVVERRAVLPHGEGAVVVSITKGSTTGSCDWSTRVNHNTIV